MWIKIAQINSNVYKNLNLDKSLQKTKFRKIFFIPFSAMDRLFNDTTQNSLRWIYRSAKIVWTKKTVEYIVPPPSRGVGTISNNSNRSMISCLVMTRRSVSGLVVLAIMFQLLIAKQWSCNKFAHILMLLYQVLSLRMLMWLPMFPIKATKCFISLFTGWV